MTVVLSLRCINDGRRLLSPCLRLRLRKRHLGLLLGDHGLRSRCLLPLSAGLGVETIVDRALIARLVTRSRRGGRTGCCRRRRLALSCLGRLARFGCRLRAGGCWPFLRELVLASIGRLRRRSRRRPTLRRRRQWLLLLARSRGRRLRRLGLRLCSRGGRSGCWRGRRSCSTGAARCCCAGRCRGRLLQRAEQSGQQQMAIDRAMMSTAVSARREEEHEQTGAMLGSAWASWPRADSACQSSRTHPRRPLRSPPPLALA